MSARSLPKAGPSSSASTAAPSSVQVERQPVYDNPHVSGSWRPAMPSSSHVPRDEGWRQAQQSVYGVGSSGSASGPAVVVERQVTDSKGNPIPPMSSKGMSPAPKWGKAKGQDKNKPSRGKGVESPFAATPTIPTIGDSGGTSNRTLLLSCPLPSFFHPSFSPPASARGPPRGRRHG